MLEKLAQWNPLRNVREHGEHRGNGIKELSQLQESLNQLFEKFFGDRDMESEDALWFPAIDISETASEVIVRADLPGMTKKDVDISLQDNVLTIQGEKKRKKKTKHENVYIAERSYGRFYQTMTLPVAVQQDKVEATFANGVLSIRLPKIEGAQPKRIAIST